jgi:hypothetical protein
MRYRHALIAIAAALAVMTAVPTSAGQPAERLRSAVDATGYGREDRAALLQEAERALRAGVPAEDLEVIMLRGAERGAPAGTVRELIGIAALTAEQRLPVRPVLDRIEQGLAKGAPPERIAAASRQLHERLAAAGPLVGGLETRGLKAASSRERQEAIESVARALERSVPDAVLMRTGDTARQHGRSMAQFDRAVRSLTLVVGSGMPADRAARLIEETVERGFTERDYARFERTMSDALRRGHTPDDAVRAGEREIREGRGPGEDRGGRMHDRGSDSGRDAGGHGGRGH